MHSGIHVLTYSQWRIMVMILISKSFFGEAIWFMVIWKTKGVLTCNTYVNTWANTYKYFHNTCRYCKLSSPVSIDTIPTGIIRILGICKSDWNLKQIQIIEMILVWSYNIMANWSLESKLDTQLVEIRNFKYHDNTCRYCVNTYRWG